MYVIIEKDIFAKRERVLPETYDEFMKAIDYAASLRDRSAISVSMDFPNKVHTKEYVFRELI